MGFAQVAWRDDFKYKIYLVAFVITLLLGLLLLLVGWLKGRWKTLVLREQIEHLKQELNQWTPVSVNTKQGVKTQHCFVVFYLDELDNWKKGLQPKIANQVLNEFEQCFNQQLNIYAGRLLGNLQNGLQLVVFEGHQALQRCFAFSSGIIYVLPKRLHDIPTPLSAMLLTDIPELDSAQYLLQMPKYKTVLNNRYEQLQQLYRQSHSNHLIVAKAQQHLFESSGKYDETPLDDLMLVTPNDNILQLWNRQLDRNTHDSLES